MKTIYVVTSGNYSDYGIEAIFDDKELARRFIDSFKDQAFREPRIEEYQLNPWIREIKKGCRPYFVRMSKDGDLTECHVSDTAYGFSNDDEQVGFDINHNMYIHVFARSDKHAIKIANEKRIQLIATGRWIKAGEAMTTSEDTGKTAGQREIS